MSLKMLSAALAMSAFFATSAQASLISEYTFDSGLQDTHGNGVDLVSAGGDIENGEYSFTAGKGVQLELLDGESYAFEVAFKATERQSRYGAFLSFNDVKDSQIYLVDEGIIFYGYGDNYRTPTSIPMGEDVVFGLSREADGAYSYFLNGVEILSGYDSSGALYLSGEKNIISLFMDNSTENLTGNIDYIRTFSEKSDLMKGDYPTNVPLVGFGLSVLSIAGFRRKNRT